MTLWPPHKHTQKRKNSRKNLLALALCGASGELADLGLIFSMYFGARKTPICMCCLKFKISRQQTEQRKT